VAWTASDATFDVQRLELSLDGGARLTVSAAGSTSYTFSALRTGSHTVSVTAFDRAGNLATVSVTVTVDTGVFSPSGPYGWGPIIGAVAAIVAAAGAFAVVRVRSRRRPPAADP